MMGRVIRLLQRRIRRLDSLLRLFLAEGVKADPGVILGPGAELVAREGGTIRLGSKVAIAGSVSLVVRHGMLIVGARSYVGIGEFGDILRFAVVFHNSDAFWRPRCKFI